MEPLVSTNPNVMHGTPCFNGARVSVQTFYDHIEAGYTIGAFSRTVSDRKTGARDRFIGCIARRHGSFCHTNVKTDLDENLPHQMRFQIALQQVFATSFMSGAD